MWMEVTKEVIRENIERVKKGLPLTMPLAILNGQMYIAWYKEANKDKIARQQKAYKKANKDKIARQQKAYYEANKDKMAR
jgi:hypothetical protein